MPQSAYLIKIFFLTLFIFFGMTGIQSSEPVFTPPETYSIIGVRAVDVTGQVHRIGVEQKRSHQVCLIFMDLNCQKLLDMLPDIQGLHQEVKENNYKVYGIFSNPNAEWKSVLAFAQTNQIDFPLILDKNGDLAQRLQPSSIPEVFVLDIYDRLLYKGSISPDLFKKLEEARPNGNQDIEAGCNVQLVDTAATTINYSEHIAPLIDANCTNCHKPHGIAPFSLESYENVSTHAGMVEYMTRKRYMPIWKAHPDYGKFSNEHRLSDYQIDLISKWVKDGLKEGPKEALIPNAAKSDSEWELGPPDLILKMEPYALPSHGDDQYRVFVMKDAIPKGKVIRAMDFHAGDPAVVHHSTIFIDYSKTLRKYDGEDPLPGYDAFEKGGTMEFGSAITLYNWAPGIGSYAYPQSVGFWVEKQADIAFENHYHMSGFETVDTSYLGIYFADAWPEKYITGSIMGSQQLYIPANENQYKKSTWTYVPVDLELYDLAPHMHFIGKEVKVSVEFPDGRIQDLLYLKDWDLAWQNVYTLRELTFIPGGSIIHAEFLFDNSDRNYANPHYPPEDMYWGWASDDEMCELYLSYIPLKQTDYGKMVASSFASFEHFYGPEDRIDIRPDNLVAIKAQFIEADIWSRAGQILLISIIESGLVEDFKQLLKKDSARLGPDFQVNYQQLLLSASYFSFDEGIIIKTAERAAKELYKILQKDPTHWNASMTYAKILLESGEEHFEADGLTILEQLMEYQESLASHEKYAKVYWELGRYYYSQNLDDKAESILQRGLDLYPQDKWLKQELASKGRIVKKRKG